MLNPSQLMFMDVDNDGDQEVFYSYGSNIYMKENYNITHTPTYAGFVPKIRNLIELLPSQPAVNGFTSTYVNNRSVDMNWKAPSEGDVSGYQLVYKLVPDAFTQKVSPVVHKVAVVNHEANALPAMGKVAVNKGSYTIGGSDPQNADATSGSAIVTNADSEISIDFGAVGKVVVPADTTTKVPAITSPYITIQDVSGDIYFDGAQRTIVIASAAGFDLKATEKVHTLEPVTMTLSSPLSGLMKYDLPANSILTIPENITELVHMVISSGVVEVINPAMMVQHQKVVNGLMFDFDTQLQSEGGTAKIIFGDGSYVRIEKGEDLLLKKLDSPL